MQITEANLMLHYSKLGHQLLFNTYHGAFCTMVTNMAQKYQPPYVVPDKGCFFESVDVCSSPPSMISVVSTLPSTFTILDPFPSLSVLLFLFFLVLLIINNLMNWSCTRFRFLLIILLIECQSPVTN